MEVVRPIPASPDGAILWCDGRLLLLDQRALPLEEQYLALDTAVEVAGAIRDMVVRGAPAIGITAAYGAALAARDGFARAREGWKTAVESDLQALSRARPTAVNLFWALERMKRAVAALPEEVDPFEALAAEAGRIHREDVAANRRLGELGAALIEGTTGAITHCNAGALATGGYGTALGVIRAAHAAGKLHRVYADETRPWLQGARLTAWELARDGIPVTLLADAAAASCMARGGVGWVIVGSDRIAANGDVANKIGTYALAVMARYHGVKFMVAAPTSTIDMQAADGRSIPIEERDSQEVLSCGGRRVGPKGVAAWNPVFDVTPATLVDALVTEKGVVLSPNREKLAQLMAS
jgi:methylthioribose-1-phosphate isomerase